MPSSEATFIPGSLSVVIPVFDEQDNLRALDAEIREVLARLDRPAEIIYVDDGSRDNSRAVLRELAERAAIAGPRTVVAQLRRNYGQTAAMSAGIQLSRGDIVIPLDADGQNNPADIPRLLAEYERGFEVVSGWRRERKDSRSRTLSSRMANWLIGQVTGVRLHDYGCTLKAYRGSMLRELHLYGDMHRFLPLYMAQLGARVSELVVDHRPRRAGRSKYGSKRVFKVLLDLFLLRFMARYYNRPMHFFGQAALAFIAAAMLVVLLMLAFKYGWLALVGIDYQASFVQTPLPALAGTFLLGSIVSVFFGIQAEILVRVYHESQGLTPYTVEDVVESTHWPAEAESTNS